MILKVGLAVKSIKDFSKLAKESHVQLQILTQEDIHQFNFIHSVLDLIIWQPEFSGGKFPEELINYFIENDDVALIIYNVGKGIIKIPQSVKKNLISVFDDPINKQTLRLLLYNSAMVNKKNSLYATNAYVGEENNKLKLIGISPAVKKINEFIDFISKSSNTHCLVRGETGTEKDKIAPIIHRKSKKPNSLLDFINCARYTNDELLMKIFGAEFHHQAKKENLKGYLERLDQGTLVLENIEYTGDEVQQRLEVFFETHMFRRIGSKTDLEVDIRIIATTERDLEKYVTQEKFSRDLYFRFKAFELTIPPLRSRKSDIIPLCKHFIGYYNHKFGHSVSGIKSEVQEQLLKYDWPGNIDELRLILQRAILLTKKGEISLAALPEDFKDGDNAKPELEFLGNCSLQEIEKMHIKRVLVRTNGNKSKAAKILNISRTTLREKMKTFDMQ
jgi:DNA-binding NtrC family response regulator